MTRTKDAAFAVIIWNNKILLFLRDNIQTISNPNCWHLPGGGIETGETPLEGVKRELKEEVSYVPKKLEYFTKITKEGGTAYLYMSFVDNFEAKNFKHGLGEGQKISFFSMKEISNLKLTPVLEYYFKKYKDEIKNSIKTKSAPNITL